MYRHRGPFILRRGRPCEPFGSLAAVAFPPESGDGDELAAATSSSAFAGGGAYAGGCAASGRDASGSSGAAGSGSVQLTWVPAAQLLSDDSRGAASNAPMRVLGSGGGADKHGDALAYSLLQALATLLLAPQARDDAAGVSSASPRAPDGGGDTAPAARRTSAKLLALTSVSGGRPAAGAAAVGASGEPVETVETLNWRMRHIWRLPGRCEGTHS